MSADDVTGSAQPLGQQPRPDSQTSTNSPIVIELSDSDDDDDATLSRTALPLRRASKSASAPIIIDLSDSSDDDDNDAPNDPHSNVLTTGKTYSSPIYLVSSDEETEADNSTLAGPKNVTTPIYMADGETDVDERTGDEHEPLVKPDASTTTFDDATTEMKQSCTPTASFQAPPSTPSYVLSFMGEDSLSDFGSPGSPSLRRSGRHRKTPSTYSLKKLTRPESVTPRRNPKARIGSDLAASPLRSPRKPLTARKQVRDEIAKVTKVKRDRFLAHYKDLFLPLLPEDKNYISNLGGHDAIVEYVELQSQPSG